MANSKKLISNNIELNSYDNFISYHQTLKDEIGIIIERGLTPRDKYVLLGNKFKDFSYLIADYYGINFPSLHNILVFLGNKFEIPSRMHAEILKLSKNFSFIKNNKNIAINDSHLDLAIKLTLLYIDLIINKIINSDFNDNLHNNQEVANDINNENNHENTTKNQDELKQKLETNFKNKYFDLLGLKYISRKKVEAENTNNKENNKESKKNYSYFLKFKSRNNEEYVIKYNNHWEKLYDSVYSNLTINALNLKYDSAHNFYFTVEISLIVLEPDLLFDATEIAETYIRSNFVYENYFLSKYKDFKTNQYLVLGNLVNFMLDELVGNDEIEFEELVKKAFKTKILSYIALFTNYKDKIFEIEVAAKIHYLNLLKIKKVVNFTTLMIEPSFISPIYGLQGRLDLLEYDKNDEHKKNIIELKSGKAPDSLLINIGGQRFNSIISFTHLIQVTCYNLLLDSTFENRTGNSYILYSASENRILRDAINHINIKREVILARNYLVFKERELIQSEGNFYNKLIEINPDKFEFAKDEINQLLMTFKNFNELQSSYFMEFTKFIFKESYSQRIGFESQNTRATYSSLWLNNSQSEKSLEENKNTNTQSNSDFIENLVINSEKTDYYNLHIYLEESDGNELQSSLRNGDLVTLIPEESNGKHIYNYLILKGYIKDISNKYIVISFRNKQIDKLYLNKYSKWSLYPDFSDATNKRLHRYLFNFVKSPNFQLFTGLISEFENKELKLSYQNAFNDENIDEITSKYSEKLSPTQFQLIKNALLTNSFYLVQGPPGSGKTSFFIKNIIEILCRFSSDNILITSYTNRAVEELCHTLHSAGLENEYLRVGTKTSNSFGMFLSEFSNENKIEDTIEKVKKCRIFIATISSLITNPELFEIKKFNIAIVDEASQILESQISVVLSNVDKFVMIGDEKQLPAISVQKPNLPSELLKNELHFSNLNISYFERMINLFQAKNWSDKYGMLIEQARMHNSIMEFANHLFYEDKLLLSKFKFAKYKSIQQITGKEKNYLNVIFDKRVVLINTSHYFEHDFDNDNDNEIKYFKNNLLEVNIISQIINDLYAVLGHNNEKIDQNTFGVISPFRLQNTTVKNNLKNSLIDTEILPDLISVDTVERYQGSEREIILFSSVVQNKSQLDSIQSLKEIKSNNNNSSFIDRKFNVAITRSKEIFILIGNKNLLSEMNSYNEFIKLCENQNGIVDYQDVIS